MRKANERAFDSVIYARIREARLSEYERRNALNALRTAEGIADAILWAKEKFAALGHFFLKPSLKH